jgi:hypothetical protein
VLYQHLCGGTEKNQENVIILSVPAEIPTENILNTSQTLRQFMFDLDKKMKLVLLAISKMAAKPTLLSITKLNTHSPI